jgi:hypothetical protein
MRPPREFVAVPRHVLFCLALLAACRTGCSADRLHHFVFVGGERERIHDAAFLRTRAFEGAQVRYTWRALEPERDRYDFRAIRDDLAFLKSRGKRLFIQLQDASFDPSRINVPTYLLTDPEYHGGADKEYGLNGEDETKAVAEGWVARRWDPAVQGRFRNLLRALGRAFDGKVEGINLAETSVDFGETGRLYPKGFTPSIYRDGILVNMRALKRAFPRSVTIQYANFMPGEWLPDRDRHYLRSVFAAARELKVGVGGPDLLPGRPGQMHHSYPLIRACHGTIRTAIAVQDGNYGAVIPKKGRAATISELVAFARDFLKVDYVFWCTQEPYFSTKLVPFLTQRQRSPADHDRAAIR